MSLQHIKTKISKLPGYTSRTQEGKDLFFQSLIGYLELQGRVLDEDQLKQFKELFYGTSDISVIANHLFTIEFNLQAWNSGILAMQCCDTKGFHTTYMVNKASNGKVRLFNVNNPLVEEFDNLEVALAYLEKKHGITPWQPDASQSKLEVIDGKPLATPGIGTFAPLPNNGKAENLVQAAKLK